jgi:CubicO group peptidase (beta-lactamase class C family)
LFPATTVKGSTSYSNLHYTLLGRVIQSVSGQHWRDYLAANLFEPAGMTRTTGYASQMYGWPDAAVPLVADGSNKLSPSPVKKADSTMHAAGGLGSSPRDLATWLRLQMNGGAINGKQILSAESVALMQTLQSEISEEDARRRPPIDGLTPKGFGFAWNILDYRGRKICAHGGGYVGSRAHISFMPDEKIGVAAAANIGDAAGPFCEMVAYDVYNKLLKLDAGEDLLPTLVEQHPKAVQNRINSEKTDANKQPVTEAMLSNEPSEVAGDYFHEDWGTIRIENKSGELAIVWGELRCKPTTTGKDAFECHFERVSRMNGRFEDGAIVMNGVDEKKEVRFQKKN